MANTTTVLNKLDKTLTDLIKVDIKKKGLVDSGKLLNSINVTTSFNGGKLKLSVEAEDYFEYVDEDNNIMKDVLASSKWSQTIEDSLLIILEESIEEKLNTN